MDEYRQEIAKAIQYAQYLKFDKSHPWHRNLVALYGALVEYSDALFHLDTLMKQYGNGIRAFKRIGGSMSRVLCMHCTPIQQMRVFSSNNSFQRTPNTPRLFAHAFGIIAQTPLRVRRR